MGKHLKFPEGRDELKFLGASAQQKTFAFKDSPVCTNKNGPGEE